MTKQSRYALNNAVHFGEVCKHSDFSEAENRPDNLFVVSLLLDCLEHVLHVVELHLLIHGDNHSCHLRGRSGLQIALQDQLVDDLLGDHSLLTGFSEELIEVSDDSLVMLQLGRTRQNHTLIQHQLIFLHLLVDS